MKLVIIIPAYNEDESIKNAIRDLPTELEGISEIAPIVIDDGSTDKTSQIVRSLGVRIESFPSNAGLGAAHRKGLQSALDEGADLIVNYDADLQYFGSEIGLLIQPICSGEAALVIGARQFSRIEGYPKYKRFTQWFWSSTLTKTLHIEIRDATSGFRAYSKDAAHRIVQSLSEDYTYSTEEICAAALLGIKVGNVPITIRFPTERSSRLIGSKLYYFWRLLVTLSRAKFPMLSERIK